MNTTPEEPASPPRHGLHILLAVLALVAYALGIGPVHALYYNDMMRDGVWKGFNYVYAPLNWLERKPVVGDLVHDYKYWCYITLKGWTKAPP